MLTNTMKLEEYQYEQPQQVHKNARSISAQDNIKQQTQQLPSIGSRFPSPSKQKKSPKHDNKSTSVNKRKSSFVLDGQKFSTNESLLYDPLKDCYLMQFLQSKHIKNLLYKQKLIKKKQNSFGYKNPYFQNVSELVDQKMNKEDLLLSTTGKLPLLSKHQKNKETSSTSFLSPTANNINNNIELSTKADDSQIKQILHPQLTQQQENQQTQMPQQQSFIIQQETQVLQPSIQKLSVSCQTQPQQQQNLIIDKSRKSQKQHIRNKSTNLDDQQISTKSNTSAVQAQNTFSPRGQANTNVLSQFIQAEKKKKNQRRYLKQLPPNQYQLTQEKQFKERCNSTSQLDEQLVDIKLLQNTEQIAIKNQNTSTIQESIKKSNMNTVNNHNNSPRIENSGQGSSKHYNKKQEVPLLNIYCEIKTNQLTPIKKDAIVISKKPKKRERDEPPMINRDQFCKFLENIKSKCVVTPTQTPNLLNISQHLYENSTITNSNVQNSKDGSTQSQEKVKSSTTMFSITGSGTQKLPIEIIQNNNNVNVNQQNSMINNNNNSNSINSNSNNITPNNNTLNNNINSNNTLNNNINNSNENNNNNNNNNNSNENNINITVTKLKM